MKVASLVGARPNFIKLAPLSRAIRKRMDEVIIHTGQHYDYEMDRIFFEELGIPEPDYHLGVGSGSHGYQTGEMLKGVEKVLMKEEPDFTIVFGDTNTTLAGALAAVKLHVKTGHVEAGLRSFDMSIPEEVNRVVADHCSDLLFCPTSTAAANLEREGISAGVHMTGDVMVDALQDGVKIAKERSTILEEMDLVPGGYHLATVHRASNTDDPDSLEAIVDALAEIGDVIFPCHPRTEKFLHRYGLMDRLLGKVRVTRPVGYLDMLVLEKNARKVLTDSGGVQKEAYILGVPCITLRKETEWVETVQDGWSVLTGPDRDRIVEMAKRFDPVKPKRDVFGTGDASERIADIVEKAGPLSRKASGGLRA